MGQFDGKEGKRYLNGEKKGPGRERYYIGNRQYVPGESDRLCVYECEMLKPLYSRYVLYRTRKGSYFLVQYGIDMETSVSLIDENAAFEFMDRHTAGIDIEIYNRVFGEPDRA